MIGLNLRKKVGQASNLYGFRGAFRNIVPTTLEQIAHTNFFENNILKPRYDSHLRRHQDLILKPVSADKLILNSLEKSGIYSTTLAELGIDPDGDFQSHGKCLFKDLSLELEKRNHKFQIVPNFQLLLKYASIFQWGISERLIAIARQYIGVPVGYDTCLCNYSIDNGVETATRRWHVDNEDRKMLKVIIYFSDVDQNSGPFQAVGLEETQRLLNIVSSKYTFLSNQQIEALAGQSTATMAHAYTGPPGTVIFVDTARLYHRGKPPVNRPRAAITFGYCSRRPLNPSRCGRHLLSREELMQLVEGMTPEQQSHVFWQDELPFWIQSIPKYTYN